MRIAVFGSHPFERPILERANANAAHGYDLRFFEPRLTRETARLASGFDVVCSVVDDPLDAGTLAALSDAGVRLIALRSAGADHADLDAAGRVGLTVVRVPGPAAWQEGLLTPEALTNIVETTMADIRAFELGEPLANEVRSATARRPAASDAAIDRTLSESFPASDAPPWTGSHAGGPVRGREGG